MCVCVRDGVMGVGDAGGGEGGEQEKLLAAVGFKQMGLQNRFKCSR